MSQVWLNLSDIVASPEFQQTITVIRHYNGKYIKGRYEEEEKEFEINAVVSASDEKSLEMLPEGDRVSLNKTVHTTEKLYLSDNKNARRDETRISDIIKYNGDYYKVLAILDADDYGFTKAVIGLTGDRDG